MYSIIKRGLIFGISIASLATPLAFADSPSGAFQAEQSIAAPITKVSFQDSNHNDITNARVKFPIRTASYRCLSYGQGATPTTIGTSDQPLYMSVPDRSAQGWQLSLSPTNDADQGWSSDMHGSGVLAINETASNGCQHDVNNMHAPAQSMGGLLLADTNALELTDDCTQTCPQDTIQRGGFHNFGISDTATIISSSAAHVGWQGTVNGTQLYQIIPAGLPADNYHLPLTITLTEL